MVAGMILVNIKLKKVTKNKIKIHTPIRRPNSKKEKWMAVYGSKNNCEISSFGRIRTRFGGFGGYIGFSGYKSTTIRYISGERKLIKVHRLVAVAFVPNPKNKPHINHKNGIKTDNRAINLEWVTASENTIHSRNVLGVGKMSASGLKKLSARVSGEGNPKAKLTKKEVKEIKSMYKFGVDSALIARDFGVHATTIDRVVKNKSWRN